MNARAKLTKNRSVHAALALGVALILSDMGRADGGSVLVRRSSDPSISGVVEGGQHPVAGSTVTFYAAGNAYSSGASVLGSAISSGSGDFTIQYTCPAQNPAVETYLTAVGGNAGNGSNPGIGLMAATRPCNALGQSSSVMVNELTTVAAEWAWAQFSDAAGRTIGAPARNSAGLVNAARLALTDLVNVSTGVPSSFWPNAAACASSPAAVNCGGLEKMDTLANILAACVSSGSATSSSCTSLFTETRLQSSATTLAAAHVIASHPAINVKALFALQGTGTNAPFQPALTQAPADWTLALNYAGGGLAAPLAVAIDAAGNAWVANEGGVVVKFAPGGRVLSGAGFTGGGLAHCSGIAIDQSGKAWVTNKYSAASNGSVTELAANGSVLSGAGGFSAGGIDYPLSIAVDRGGNVWVGNYANASVTRNPQLTSAANFAGGGLSFPVSIAIDASLNVWAANFGNDSVSELGSQGSPLSGSGGYTAGGLDGPAAIVLDVGSHAWIANYYGDSITELASNGSAAAGSPFKGGGLFGPASIALDGAGSIWVANYSGNSLSEFQGSSTASPGKPVSSASGFEAAGLDGPNGIAIDASGSLWVANFNGDSVTEFVGVAVPVKTPVFGPPVKP